MTNGAPVLKSREGVVGVLELATPKTQNALSSAAFEAIDAALDDFEKEGSGVRVILFRAQGKNFCTGADLREAKVLRSDPAKFAAFLQRGHDVLCRLERSALPVVAACQGLALAGGGELMMACDVVFASTDFRFGDQHAQYGLVPGWGGSQRLPRIVGLRRSLDLFYSAAWIDAATALQWGLVNHVVDGDKLHESALAYCVKVATRSRPGLGAMKKLAREGLEGTLADGLRREVAVVPAHMSGADVTEGLAAFEARRDPVFPS